MRMTTAPATTTLMLIKWSSADDNDNPLSVPWRPFRVSEFHLSPSCPLPLPDHAHQWQLTRDALGHVGNSMAMGTGHKIMTCDKTCTCMPVPAIPAAGSPLPPVLHLHLHLTHPHQLPSPTTTYACSLTTVSMLTHPLAYPVHFC